MNILDPIELMDNRIDREYSKVDKDETYPCAQCGERYSLADHDWICMSPMGDGPLVCENCFDLLLAGKVLSN